MITLAILAAVFFLVGAICLCAGAVYYAMAKAVHANADALTAESRRLFAAAEAGQQQAADLLARIQEHSVC